MPKAKDLTNVLEFIKASDHPVRKQDIVQATGFTGDFSHAINNLIKANDELQIVGSGKFRSYIWKPQKAIYSDMKNPEGYTDSTAGKAIANVMKSMSDGKYPMRQKFGEVWSCNNVLDDLEGVLIISANDGMIFGYNVYPSKKGFMKDGHVFKWVDNEGSHYISVMSPVNTNERKLVKKVLEVGAAEKIALKEKVSQAIGISINPVEVVKTVEVPVEVEKIVEKEVPVEKIVEKIVEVPTMDPKELELALLRQKVDIYEMFLRGEFKGIAS